MQNINNPEYWSLVVGQADQTIRCTVAYGVMQIAYPVVLSEIYTTLHRGYACFHSTAPKKLLM
ncbi:MAG: hypothetical protein IJU35_03185 [Paludibacteraceae bacterium]|nr:hypothetical protein [Paludibacteraceae bacterium]